MSALSINPPFPVFTDIDGQPLEAGYIFIGTANLDPQTNPINVFFDAALTIPAAQPIRTLAGYPSFNGTPARLYVGSNDYSIRVQNKNGSTVYSAASGAQSISAGLVSFVGFKGQVGTVEDLADDDGSDWIGFEQPGGSAVARSVQDKLREIASRADFVDDAAFIAGKGDKPNIDGNDNFDAKVTPEGEGPQIDLSASIRPTAGMNRGRVNYFSGDAVEVILPETLVMGGFRFMGQYKKGRAPVFNTNVAFRAVASMITDLGAESVRTNDNWYAVFACANDGDTNVTYKLMPYIRVGSVLGSACTLNYGGENSHTITPITYTWADGALVGADCLVINEGSENRFSGRVTTVTANTGTTVSLATIGSVGAYDYLLVAPPGFDQYAYLCSFYSDGAGAPYNIADTGCTVMSYMSDNQDPNWIAAGAVAGPPGNKIMWGGYIPPLASGVIMRSALSTSTSGGGDIYTNFSHDSSNHVIGVHSYYKDATAGTSTQVVFLNIDFSISQFMYYWVDGPLASQRILGQIRAQGWIEP